MNRDLYAEITPHIQLAWYRDLWTGVVLSNLDVLLPLLAVFEALIAVAVLWNGRVAMAGLLAGAVFNVAIAPLGFWWPVNLALAGAHLALVPIPYPETTVSRLRRRVVPGRVR